MVSLRVYKIVNDVDEYVYVGSTTKDLASRFDEHISAAEVGKKVNYMNICVKLESIIS